MKNAIIGFTFAIVMVYMYLIHSCIMTKDIRQNELDLGLNSAIRTTMEQAFTDSSQTTITTDEELMDMFNENFLQQMESDSTFTVEFMTVDVEDGLLDVKVTSEFTYPYKTVDEPDGVKGKVTSRRTVILDTIENSGE